MQSFAAADPTGPTFLRLCKKFIRLKSEGDTSRSQLEVKDGDGNTQLHWAAGSNPDPEVITALVEAGADVKAQGGDGYTPLHVAALNNSNPEVIAALLKAGADLKAVTHKHGNMPLHDAAWNNSNPEVLAALLKAGADVDAQNKNGHTPLHAAMNNSNPEVISALLKAGANPIIRDKSRRTAGYYAGRNEKLKDTEMYRLLHDVGDGFMALCKEGPVARVSVILQAGADLKVKDGDGNTPLHWAAAATRTRRS